MVVSLSLDVTYRSCLRYHGDTRFGRAASRELIAAEARLVGTTPLLGRLLSPRVPPKTDKAIYPGR